MSFPTYGEYRQFLERHAQRQFNENSYYECSMAILGEGQVSEGYASDMDMDAPDWFAECERRSQARGLWSQPTSGSEILSVLLEVDPDGCYPQVFKVDEWNDWATLRLGKTVEVDGRMQMAASAWAFQRPRLADLLGASEAYEARLGSEKKRRWSLCVRRHRKRDRFGPPAGGDPAKPGGQDLAALHRRHREQ